MDVDVDEGTDEIYKAPLKSEETIPKNPQLKRSYSSPNLAQVKKFKTNHVNISSFCLFCYELFIHLQFSPKTFSLIE